MPETADSSLIIPPLPEKGDTFGIIAPAGPWKDEEFQKGISILEGHGFRVKLPAPLPAGQGYLAGSDRQRLKAFEQIWQDPEVKVVMPARGGYGSLRLLNLLDYRFIRANPKLLVGFSDVCCILQALYRYCGLLAFHGPMLTTLNKCNRTSLEFLFEQLSGRVSRISPDRIKILKAGDATGILSGGNLTTLAHLTSTAYEISWQDKIIFLEDVGESPYRIDRLFTHLYMAGKFKGIRGLILGEFSNCGDEEDIWDLVLELFQKEDFPIWADFPVGHGLRNLTLPLGVEAGMDSARKELSFTLSGTRLF
ncbi:MAG: LD-carboxypeptidase [Desulfurivibrionaceae bacterium]